MIRRFLSLFVASMLFFGCAEQIDRPEANVIPRPVKQVDKEGVFLIDKDTKIVVDAECGDMKAVAGFLSDHISSFFRISNSVTVSSELDDDMIMFKHVDDAALGKEGYRLTISEDNVVIEGSHQGLFYAVQTLKQLMPTKREQLKRVVLPALEIEDTPRFAWRGAMMDVCRHFFSVEEVYTFIDYLALHKLNTLHWHLTEDQGWRVEIKKYPKLAEISSQRKETLIGHGGKKPFKYDGKPYGGYFTQEEIKSVVAYAQERYIEVIPEIELPGHALAALAAYPELGCTGGPYETATRWGVFDDVYCAGNEQTFEFLTDVISEVVELFPSKYFHIGGDECPKGAWEKCKKCQARMKKEGLDNEHELQSYVIKRVEKLLNSKGKTLIGWDEILEGGLAPNAAVMSWRGIKGGIAAAKEGHDVIMTPNSHMYFDHYQAPSENEPLAIGGFLNLSKVYSYEPLPEELSVEEQKHILGVQANLWAEYIPTFDHLEYMAMPRMAALAEVGWSPKEGKDFDNFFLRLSNLRGMYDSMDINYCSKAFDGTDKREEDKK